MNEAAHSKDYITAGAIHQMLSDLEVDEIFASMNFRRVDTDKEEL